MTFGCHVYLFSFNLKQFLVSLMTWTFLKTTSQLFFRMPLNLSLLDCFLMIRFRLYISGRDAYIVSLKPHPRKFMMSL
jgi:hypothetical protein